MRDVLRLLRLLALLLLITLIMAGIALLHMSGLPHTWLWWVRAGLALLPILFVLMPNLERRLGERHLPIALFLFITTLAIELTLQSSGRLAREFLTQAGQELEWVVTTWRSERFFFLLVPTVLAAWAYGRPGAVRAAAWATLLHIGGGLWLWHAEGAFPQGYWVSMPIRLMILFAVPLIVAYLATRQRQQHQALQSAHQQLQRQATLAEELAASRERNRLARELHDTLAHSLAGLVVELEAVNTLFDIDGATARTELGKAQELARAGLDETRAAIQGLRESPAQAVGLAPALRQLVNEFGERTGLQTQVAFAASGPDPSLPPETSEALYRIAQEALTNIERHADATAVTLQVESTADALTMILSDDGVGFEPASASDGHYGLVGIRERAKLIGADVTIKSAPEQGTRICVKLDGQPTNRLPGANL